MLHNSRSGLRADDDDDTSPSTSNSIVRQRWRSRHKRIIVAHRCIYACRLVVLEGGLHLKLTDFDTPSLPPPLLSHITVLLPQVCWSCFDAYTVYIYLGRCSCIVMDRLHTESFFQFYYALHGYFVYSFVSSAL